MHKTTPLPSRLLLAHDHLRPRIHFLPPANWMNDPNGLIQWQGQYHLFYQYNPEGAFHSRIHWGHALSADLVHWQDYPIALFPTPGGADQDGCWSGSAIDHEGVPTFFYTGVNPQVVCVATSQDGLMTWQKYPEPVIATLPDGLDAGTPWDFRDPFVWREGALWYMVIGSRQVGVGGKVLLYRSSDLRNWEYRNALLEGDMHRYTPYWTGTMWECPNFFRLGDKYVLMISYQDGETGHLLYPGYLVGDFVDERFYPSTQGLLEYGGAMYAPQVMRDEQGRWLLWGWLMEARGRDAQISSGWSGVMTLPRVLSLQADNHLTLEPAPELAMLRGRGHTFAPFTLTPDTANPLADIRGDCLEILITFAPGDAREFGLQLGCSPDGVEQTGLIYTSATQTVTVDRSLSSRDESVTRALLPWQQVVAQAPSPPDAAGQITWHIFLDGSVLELFVRGRVPLSCRIYPTHPDSLGLQLYSRDGVVTISALTIWPLESIW